MKVLGMISGTSFDGIDWFVGDFILGDGASADAVSMARIDSGSDPYSDELHSLLAKALPPATTTAHDMCVIDTGVGQAFADVAVAVLAKHSGIDLIVSHGQTIYHWVDEQGRARGTMQFGNPAWIAERTGVPVVSDVRSRDVASGGHGAPLASLMDVLLLSADPGRVGAVNLGGISNITVVGGNREPIAYDVGPSNALIDAVMLEISQGQLAYDEDARLASRGIVDQALLKKFLSEPYYAQSAPKSTGKELFNLDYIERMIGPVADRDASDLLATLVELTCVTVMDEVRRLGMTRLYVAGGGTANPLMMQRMRALADGIPVEPMSVLGVDPREKEPAFFALIGFLTVHGLPANIPSCTGAAGPRIMGSITPGRYPLQLPPAHSTPVRRLVVV